MLLKVLHTGLTFQRKVWREGEIFEVTEKGTAQDKWMLREYPATMSEVDWEKKQIRYYGISMFRRLNDTELRDSFGKGLIILDQMSDEEKKVISETIKGKIDEIRVTSEKLKQEVASIEQIEVEKEETVEVKEEEILELKEEEEVIPGQVLQEGSESVPVKKKKDK